MSDIEGEVRVRSVRTRRSDSFMESAMEFGGGVVRLGFSVFTLPFALLPSESRQHMRNATQELMYAFASLPADFANIAGDAIEDWASESDPTPPRPMANDFNPPPVRPMTNDFNAPPVRPMPIDPPLRTAPRDEFSVG